MIKRFAVVAATLMMLGAIPSFADITFTTNTTPPGGDPVKGTADFTISGNTLTLILTNNTTAVDFGDQVLTGLSFTTTGTGGATLALNTVSPTGIEDCTGSSCATVSTFIDYDTNAGAGCTSGSKNDWTCGSPYTWTYSSSLLAAGAGSYKPGGIVNTTVNNSQSSIPTSNHNDYLLGPATFTFTFSSGTLTGISGVTFDWGTGPAQTSGTPSGGITTFGSPVPEPASLVFLGTIVAGIAGIGRKRMQRNG